MQQQSIRVKVIGSILTLILAAGTLQAQSVWNSTTGGDWDTAGNWNPATVPDSVAVTFGSAITENSTVNMDTNRTVTGLTINNSTYAYTLDGPGTLTVDQGGGGGSISFTGANHDIRNNLSLTGVTALTGTANISGDVHFQSGAKVDGGTVELSGALSGDVDFGGWVYVTLSGTSTLTEQISMNSLGKMDVVDGANISVNVGTGTAWFIDRHVPYSQTGGTVNLNNGRMQLGNNRDVTGTVSGGTLTAGEIMVHTTGGYFKLNGGAVNLAEGVIDVANRTANFEFTGGTLTATSDNFKLQNLKGGEAGDPVTYAPVIQDATSGNSLLDLSGYNALFSKTAYTAAVSSGSNTATVRVGETLTLSATDLNNAPTLLTIGNQARLEALNGATITGGGGVVITDGGTLALGTATTVASATIQTLTLEDGAKFEWKMLNGTTYDQIFGTTLTLPETGMITIDISGLAGYEIISGQNFTLFDSVVENFSADRFNIVDSGNIWENGWRIEQGSLVLVAIPEPSSLMLLGLAGLAGALFMRRRRR